MSRRHGRSVSRVPSLQFIFFCRSRSNRIPSAKVSVLGDLPPIGKGCLLAPEGTVPTSTTDESTPKTSPHTPATLAGMVTPEVQSPKGKSETFQTRVDAPLGKEVAIEQPKSEEPKLVEPVAAAEAPGPV